MTYFFGTHNSVLLVLASLVCANNGVVRAEDPFDIDINELIDLAVAQIEDPIDKPISTVDICNNDTLVFQDENPDVSDAMLDYFGSMNTVVGLGGENENSMMARMFGSNKNMGMFFGSEEKEIYRQACDAVGGYFLETTSENITATCNCMQDHPLFSAIAHILGKYSIRPIQVLFAILSGVESLSHSNYSHYVHVLNWHFLQLF
mmetsp:Transcript_25925/g.33031  ORF Transcript_25925/g.33031 Transcript_25925/m.33031 type:complete len:204 (-) Transcript_25925:2088-2699(-)